LVVFLPSHVAPKEKLTALHLKTRSANDERPEEASLADVLRRYGEARGSKVCSAKSNRHCIKCERRRVGAMKRQEEFHQDMRERGFSPAGEGGTAPSASAR
jgi:hypothetical protein